jgi:hypothetical protein
VATKVVVDAVGVVKEEQTSLTKMNGFLSLNLDV